MKQLWFAIPFGLAMTLISCASTPVKGSAVQSSATPAASPSASAPSASTAGASGTISVAATESAQFALSETEKKTLLSEFNRAQSNEEKAFTHTSRSEMKELVASQNQKIRTWREQEKTQRRQFFAQHSSGPERRQYVQEYLKRKKDFDQAIKSELDAAKKAWNEKADRLKQKQKEQRTVFKAQLQQNKRPDANLWPN